jgi:molybdenum cofactor biosynthesis enzyme MoaA
MSTPRSRQTRNDPTQTVGPYGRVRVVVTNYCNLRCRYCFNEGYPSRGRVFASVALIRRRIAELSFRPSGIKLTGGEPFAHPKLEVIAAALEEVAPVTVTTNGMFLGMNFEKLPSTVLVTVSVFGTNSSEFSAYTRRPKHDFDVFERQLHVVRSCPQRFAANVLVRPGSAWQLERYVEYCAARGFRLVRFLTLIGPEKIVPSYLTNLARVRRFFSARGAKASGDDTSVVEIPYGQQRLQLLDQYTDLGEEYLRKFGYVWLGPLGEFYSVTRWSRLKDGGDDMTKGATSR